MVDLQEGRPGIQDGWLGKGPKVPQALGVRSGERDWGKKNWGDGEHGVEMGSTGTTSCRAFAVSEFILSVIGSFRNQKSLAASR